MPPPLTTFALMAHVCWFGILLAGAVAVELLGAGVGLLLPGALFLGFYLAVVCRWELGLLLGALALCLVEMALCRHGSALILLVPLLALAGFWRRHGDRVNPLTLTPVGLLLGGGYALYVLFAENPRLAQALAGRDWWSWLGLPLTGALAGAFALPLLTMLADFGAARLEFARFHQRRLSHDDGE